MPVSADQIIRLYDTVFDRAPDADGLAFWTRVADAGLGLDYMAERFIVAPEFATTYGQPDSLSFVRSLYENILDRPGEAEGVSFWTAALDEGRANRAGIVTGFSESPEHVAQMAAPAQPAPAQPVPVVVVPAPVPEQPVPAQPAEPVIEPLPTPIPQPEPVPVRTYPSGVTESLWTGGGTIVRAPDGQLTIYGTPGADAISGTEGNDFIVGVGFDQTGGQMDARYAPGVPHPALAMQDRADTLSGLAGDDTLYGGAGDDVMNGGAGNDVLVGMAGADTMTGGPGSDAFFFGWVVPGDTFYEYHGGAMRDVITDFQVGVDKIDLSGYLNGNLGAIWQGAGAFVPTNPRLQARITETADGTTLHYLTNIAGENGIVEFIPRSATGGTIELPGVTGLTAGDVFLG